ncbi:hypothetical protein FJ938_13160 [Mesorhizobium sp. B2-4-14]|uniref:hypothetical protein n=1 Tax=Mesorhizobium sp. B2-4-14 TaxID=2589935 RepID=UPI0011282151|nr:hypothetical protein [Mesorhizobium sp. B2-4-14]TPL06422.1 hypothetical protein FJ938_13160 [Mesorhizobium sp. B2-4-14]
MGKIRHEVYRAVGRVERAAAEQILALRPTARNEAVAWLVERLGVDETADRLGISAEQINEFTLQAACKKALRAAQRKENPQ